MFYLIPCEGCFASEGVLGEVFVLEALVVGAEFILTPGLGSPVEEHTARAFGLGFNVFLVIGF